MKVKRYKLYQESLIASYDKASQIERDLDATVTAEQLLEEHTGALIHDFGSYRIFFFMTQKCQNWETADKPNVMSLNRVTCGHQCQTF